MVAMFVYVAVLNFYWMRIAHFDNLSAEVQSLSSKRVVHVYCYQSITHAGYSPLKRVAMLVL